MKNNRISTRVLAVFAAVLLIMTLSVPAFAATSYIFFGTSDGIGVGDLLPPEGSYWVSFYMSDVGGSLVSSQPVDISYTSLDSYTDLFWEGEATFFDVDTYVTLPVMVGRSVWPNLVLNCASLMIDGESVFEGDTLTFIPAYEDPSLSDYIPADTFPNVFNEIISLLPIALGALVGFIAIRKGIAYLQNVLHSS